MSVKQSAAVWELNLPRLEKLVALAVADWANDDGFFYASIRKIAWKCQCSERTVQRILEQFRGTGLVTPVVTGPDGRKVSTIAAPKGGRYSVPEYRLDTSNSDKLAPFRTITQTNLDFKGDNLTPVLELERVTNTTERVTNRPSKGDKNGVSPKSILNKRINVLNVSQNLGGSPRPQFDTNCGNVENPQNHEKITHQSPHQIAAQLQNLTRKSTPQQVNYAIVNALADTAVSIWRARHTEQSYTLADLAADLKTHAAHAGQPYSPDVIDRAISVANERGKTFHLTILK